MRCKQLAKLNTNGTGKLWAKLNIDDDDGGGDDDDNDNNDDEKEYRKLTKSISRNNWWQIGLIIIECATILNAMIDFCLFAPNADNVEL